MEKPKNLTDSELLDLLKQDREVAFSEIYGRYFDRLYIHALGMLHDGDAAADVVQDVFAYLWNHREVKIRTSLSAYLYASTRHAVLKVIRRMGVADRFREHVVRLSEQPTLQTDDLVRLRELEALIDSEIDKWPRKRREVFELKYNDDRTNREIAELLGVSEHTVKNQLANSLRVLRHRLSKWIFLVVVIFHPY